MTQIYSTAMAEHWTPTAEVKYKQQPINQRRKYANKIILTKEINDNHYNQKKLNELN